VTCDQHLYSRPCKIIQVRQSLSLVTNKDHCSCWHLPPFFFCDVANGKVYRPCWFITSELWQTFLIWRKNDRHYDCSFWQLFLDIEGQYLFSLLDVLDPVLTCLSPHQSAVHISSITWWSPVGSVYAHAGAYTIWYLNKGFPIKSLIHLTGLHIQSLTSLCIGWPVLSVQFPWTLTFLQFHAAPCGSSSTFWRNDQLLWNGGHVQFFVY